MISRHHLQYNQTPSLTPSPVPPLVFPTFILPDRATSTTTAFLSFLKFNSTMSGWFK